MVLTVSFALSSGSGLYCHRRLRGVSGPLGLTSPSANLTPASRRQDHTSLRPGFSAGKNTVKPNVYKKAATGRFRQGRNRDSPRRGRPKDRDGRGWTRLGARRIWCSRCSGLALDTWRSLQGWLALLGLVLSAITGSLPLPGALWVHGSLFRSLGSVLSCRAARS
jgi:hypothetical protein